MNKSGFSFTLVELLIVVGIIGILGAAISTAILGVGKSGRDSKRKADIEQIRSALEMYRSNDTQSRYPILDPGAACSSLPGLVPAFIAQIPRDPSRNRNYYCFSNGSSYRIRTALENIIVECPGAGTGCGSGVNCSYAVNQYGQSCP